MVARAPGAEPPPYPRRFRGAPVRNERLARPLRRIAGVGTVDEELLARIGHRMFARDEPAARLARAMSRDGPERVSMAQVRRALAGGLDAVPGAPAPLRHFLDVVERTPPWVDAGLLERGGRALRRMAPVYDDVLLALSLIGGYRFGGPADLLVATGALTGDTAIRRLGETETWARALSRPGGMRRDGEGFALTVHVRLVHALVNRAFETNGRWDVGRWGLPINQTDLATTLGLFNSTGLLGVRALGWVVTPAESRAVMHLWRYVGWLMGVDEDWLFDTEREQNAFNYHVLLAQDDVTPAGAALAGALVDGQRGIPQGPFAGLRGRYRRLRLLSMLRWFLGARGLADLDLPVTPTTLPWAVPPTVARNLVASAAVARTRTGRRRLEAAGDRFLEGELAGRFAGDRPGVTPLPA